MRKMHALRTLTISTGFSVAVQKSLDTRGESLRDF